MGETIQVVRVDEPLDIEIVDGRYVMLRSYEDHGIRVTLPNGGICLGDVIELTEEQRPNTYDEAMEHDPPAPHIRRRFFTEWEAVDE